MRIRDLFEGMLTSKSMHNRGMVLFPSSLCSAAVFIIQMLDDPAVTSDGKSFSCVLIRSHN